MCNSRKHSSLPFKFQCVQRRRWVESSWEKRTPRWREQPWVIYMTLIFVAISVAWTMIACRWDITFLLIYEIINEIPYSVCYLFALSFHVNRTVCLSFVKKYFFFFLLYMYIMNNSWFLLNLFQPSWPSCYWMDHTDAARVYVCLCVNDEHQLFTYYAEQN